MNNYRQVSNIRRTKSQHLKYPRTVLRLPLPNPLKPDVNNYNHNNSINNYRQVSNIRRTKSQHLKGSRTVLWLSLPNPLKPDVKSRMKM